VLGSAFLEFYVAPFKSNLVSRGQTLFHT